MARSSLLSDQIMRFWTLHPGYLDSRGLVALWREALRARALSELAAIRFVSRPDPHPLFRIVPGAAAEWEITLPSRARG